MMISSIRYFVRTWRRGLKNGYPWCCVLHFCIDQAVPWTDPNQSVRRGGIERDGMCYVPCFWHKRLGEPYPYPTYIDEDGMLHVVIRSGEEKICRSKRERMY